MSEASTSTTSNGHEIQHPRERLSFPELQGMLTEYGIVGANPTERLKSLRKVSVESLALLMTDMNRRLQGADETLVHEGAMKIGDKETVDAADRYDLFTNTVAKIKASDENINPARVGDTLALATVLLHPFKDGNGRTARMLGFVFRDDFDAPDAATDFSTLAEPRDAARERGGFMIYGYIPYVGENADQSDPQVINNYIDTLLSEDGRIYTGPYGQAELEVTAESTASQQERQLT